MRAEELLAEVEALGVVVTIEARDLLLRPRSRLSPDLVEEIRTHKAELLDLVELRGWPDASRDAVRRFGAPEARLYPFLGRTVATPDGPGRLVQVFAERVTVVLETDCERARCYLPSEVGPPGMAAVWPAEQAVH